MSFILDALRKSESERQREAAPSLSRAPLAQVRHRIPAWIWALISILLAALIALGAAWWQGRTNETLATDSTAPATSVPSADTTSQLPADEPEPESEATFSVPTALRSMNELARFGPNLPDYRLELLAYNPAEPAASWARINGRRYAAGDRIGGGPELIELRADGVVIGYAGERFLLTAR